jgi:arginase
MEEYTRIPAGGAEIGLNDISLQHRLKSIQVVGVASGCGAPDPGCEAGVDALREMRITSRLRARGFSVRWGEVIRPAAAFRADSLRAVRRICTRLAKRVEHIVREGDMPVVVGGDHTIAIGTWKGVAHARAEQGLVGLLWIDAHMDAHTPQTTESGMLHGMPVACLLGYGYPELTAIAEGAKLDPKCVCLYGVRSFERGEAELLSRLGVRVFFMEEIVRRGIRETLKEALEIVSCASGGMRGAPLMSALAEHGGHPDLVGVEIVEYNPYRDRHAATAGLVGDALDAILAGQARL